MEALAGALGCPKGLAGALRELLGALKEALGELSGSSWGALGALLGTSQEGRPFIFKNVWFFIGFTTKVETCDSKNGKRARGMGTKHRLINLESKHAFVDHLHPLYPCSRNLQTKITVSHPLRGTSLRSDPRSSRKKYQNFLYVVHACHSSTLLGPRDVPECPHRRSHRGSK